MNLKHASLSLLLILVCTYPLVNLGYTTSSLNATVETDKASYKLREIVNVTGNVTYDGELVQDGLIAIQIDDPTKTLIARTLHLSTNSPEQWSIEIVSVIPCDTGGNFKPAIKRGTSAWFKVTIKNNALVSRKVLIVINIYDSNLIPLDIAAVSLDVGAGDTATFQPQMYISHWASTGAGIIYANVYSDWPKDGGYPRCPEKSTNFYIIDSEYDEYPHGQNPEPPAQNGTYEMQFRLSPECLPGTYTVTASAWYVGEKDLATTVFNVIYVPTPPWPSFFFTPPMAIPGFKITFDASASSAEGYNDSITSYTWNFGDNQSSTGTVVKHAYAQLGNYTVTLNVTDSEGFWNTTSKTVTIAIIRDITVINIQSLKEVYNNWLAPVTATVKNKGTTFENFNVTLYCNSSFVETKKVTNLGPTQHINVTFAWNTTGLILCANYTLQATADILENEANTTDNTMKCGPIWIKMLGDIDGNREIDIFDVVKVTYIYKSKEGDSKWNLMADLRRDGTIDIFDVVIVCAKYKTRY